MHRSTRRSTFLVAVMLSPAVLQSGDCNAPSGNTQLSSLELEAGGEDRVLEFTSSQRIYDVWVPDTETSAVVRAQSVDLGAQLSVSYLGAVEVIGTGSGEISVDVALGPSKIVLVVAAPQGATASYVLNVDHSAQTPACNGGVAQSQVVTAGCMTDAGISLEQWILPFELSVNAGSIVGGQPLIVELSGTAYIAEWILDLFQTPLIYGGTSQLPLNDLVATVQVRSGATGPDVPLTVDASALIPGPTSFCTIAPSNDTVCDPANDWDPNNPLMGNADCLPSIIGNYCDLPINMVDIPTSSDCAPGGLCDSLGKADGPDSQCGLNSFCVTGPLAIPLATQTAGYVADASGGEVLWGWADQGVPGLVLCPDAGEPRCESSGGTVPDGRYALPGGVFSEPTGPIGARMLHNAGLAVPQQCAMATQSVDGGGAPIPNVVEPTPDGDLIACPIN